MQFWLVTVHVLFYNAVHNLLNFLPCVIALYSRTIDDVTRDITCLQKSHRVWTSCRHDLYTAQLKKTKSYINYGDCTV